MAKFFMFVLKAIGVLWVLGFLILLRYGGGQNMRRVRAIAMKATHIGREFRQPETKPKEQRFTTPLVVAGLSFGQVERRGKKVFHLQFENILEGKRRILDIYLPVDGEGSIDLVERESKAETKPIGPVYAWLKNDTSDSQIVLELRTHEHGKPSDPYAFMETKLGYKAKSQQENPVMVMALHTGWGIGTKQIGANYTLWTPSAKGLTVTSTQSLFADLWICQIQVKDQVREPYLHLGKLVLAGIIDFFTYPFQAVMILFTALGGGVV